MNSNYWWKNTVVYEMYLQSFKDSNNDGIGDLNGAIEKLEYLKNLGIGAIWLTPIYKSPLVDNGYDISDYKDINLIYGDLDKFKEFVDKADSLDIKIVMDLVLNHTSDQHEWFKQARSSKDNPYRDYYIWRDEPSDINSVFGGSAWEYDETTNQYYFHLFAKEQPDLNWENPKVREEIAKTVKWWCDFGIKGFRLDVIDLIGKEVDKKILNNGPNLHKYLQDLRVNSWKTSDVMTVGECWGATIDQAIQFSNDDNQEFSMVFNFEPILSFFSQEHKFKKTPVDFVKFKKIFEKWQQGLFNKGWSGLFLTNHDMPRMVSRFGNDKEYRIESSKTISTAIYLMQGTPFIHQGDEIGMTNVNWTDLNKYRDVEILNTYQTDVLGKKNITHDEFIEGVLEVGRDHSRTPIQWDDSEFAGFSKTRPWIDVNDNYKEVNAKNDLANPNGIYNFLKSLISFRNKSQYADIINNGWFELIKADDKNIFAYSRTFENKTIKIISNWSENIVDISDIVNKNEEVLLNTESSFDDMKLQPWQSIVVKQN
ncbi:alpha-glucosidase [Mycoplasma sp. HU2014]|uniref:alpha-glucosidase n=1 Tax=Mycoplasma sp. HU2014 TaxID=1664275 RepID=UPI00067BA8B4|nr:alpha-glucosidase [Mycoplasma sp. HU2014]KNG79535.1 oligo-1,6-glucosidase [Mycoplasma sp. HU2014]